MLLSWLDTSPNKTVVLHDCLLGIYTVAFYIGAAHYANMYDTTCTGTNPT